MTIFSIDLNSDFKFSNQTIYSNQKNFTHLCKKNSLDIKPDELSEYKLENKLIKANLKNFPLPTRRYNKEELCKYRAPLKTTL